MILEQALTQMRLGKKITHPLFESDVYFMACRIGFSFIDTPHEDKPISIVKMKGERAHEDMGTGSIDDICYRGTMMIRTEFIEKPCKHGFRPQLDLFLLMSDDWIVIEEIDK